MQHGNDNQSQGLSRTASGEVTLVPATVLSDVNMHFKPDVHREEAEDNQIMESHNANEEEVVEVEVDTLAAKVTQSKSTSNGCT